MQGITQILIVAVIVHVSLFGATIFLTNAIADLPYYGGDHGFLPSTATAPTPTTSSRRGSPAAAGTRTWRNQTTRGGIASCAGSSRGPSAAR